MTSIQSAQTIQFELATSKTNFADQRIGATGFEIDDNLAGPLRGQLLQQPARCIFQPYDFRHQQDDGNREHAVAECLQPIGF
jgi:hypothetical protein